MSKIDSRRGSSANVDSQNVSWLPCCYNILRSPLPLACCIIAAVALSSYFMHRADDYFVVNQSLEPLPIEPDSSQHEIGLSLQPRILENLKALEHFPKIVHIIWNDRNILDSSYQMLEHGAKNLRRLNPDWDFRVHTFEDIERGIQQFEHPDIPESAKKDLENAHVVEKTDAYRLIRIYETGGLYVDIDRVMNKNLDEIIDPKTTRLVIPTYYDINFAQDLFGSSPKNDLILNVFIRQCTMREKFPRENGWLKSSDHMELVQTFSNSLELDLFGRALNGRNRTLVWDEARHILESHTADMVVTKKDVWCDGLLVRDYRGCKQVSRQDLYQDFNVTPWGPQVDAVWKAAEEGA